LSELAIVILAGGEGRRFPGKLERRIGQHALLLTVYNHMHGAYPVYISARATFSREIDAALDCSVIVDRWEGRGPLGGLATVASTIGATRLFAVAGDAPAVTLDVLHALEDAWRTGDEAAVPAHSGGIEPLAALYDRAALLREATLAMDAGSYSMHGLIERLRARHVPMASEYFVNINTEADLVRIGGLD
jgi:molybdopterin-guanine dinucleotide biosynthesis protein A